MAENQAVSLVVNSILVPILNGFLFGIGFCLAIWLLRTVCHLPLGPL